MYQLFRHTRGAPPPPTAVLRQTQAGRYQEKASSIVPRPLVITLPYPTLPTLPYTLHHTVVFRRLLHTLSAIVRRL